MSNERIINCPKCGKLKFSYNTVKKVGQCFRAKCRFTAGPRYLEKKGLVSLDLWDLDHSLQVNVGSEKEPIALPERAKPIVTMENGQLVTKYPIACSKIYERGVSAEDQLRFNLHLDTERVYIPVYAKGELVQYLGRECWWLPSVSKNKYKYAKGANITNYLFNWDEMGKLPYITIVENTFNAIRYRKLLNTTSCFGSHLSKVQVALIARSCVKFVIMLWDEGTEVGASEAVNALREAGTEAVAIRIKGQPDDHSEEHLIGLVDKVRR